MLIRLILSLIFAIILYFSLPYVYFTIRAYARKEDYRELINTARSVSYDLPMDIGTTLIRAQVILVILGFMFPTFYYFWLFLLLLFILTTAMTLMSSRPEEMFVYMFSDRWFFTTMKGSIDRVPNTVRSSSGRIVKRNANMYNHSVISGDRRRYYNGMTGNTPDRSVYKRDTYRRDVRNLSSTWYDINSERMALLAGYGENGIYVDMKNNIRYYDGKEVQIVAPIISENQKFVYCLSNVDNMPAEFDRFIVQWRTLSTPEVVKYFVCMDSKKQLLPLSLVDMLGYTKVSEHQFDEYLLYVYEQGTSYVVVLEPELSAEYDRVFVYELRKYKDGFAANIDLALTPAIKKLDLSSYENLCLFNSEKEPIIE